jgi:hypothetical protein
LLFEEKGFGKTLLDVVNPFALAVRKRRGFVSKSVQEV